MTRTARVAALTTAFGVAICTASVAQSRPSKPRLDPEQSVPAAAVEADPIKRRLAKVDRTARHGAGKFRRLEVAGEDVRRNVDRLTSRMRWHSTLRGALRAARGQDKPVVWVQALGDLTGYL